MVGYQDKFFSSKIFIPFVDCFYYCITFLFNRCLLICVLVNFFDMYANGQSSLRVICNRAAPIPSTHALVFILNAKVSLGKSRIRSGVNIFLSWWNPVKASSDNYNFDFLLFFRCCHIVGEYLCSGPAIDESFGISFP
jgi:hypothetical protein